jgi:type VI protein secretion system component Hcp
MPLYMYFPGVNGDVTAADYQSWIELESVEHCPRLYPGAYEKKRPNCVPLPSVRVTKTVDGATVGLYQAWLKSKGPGVEVKIDRVENGARQQRLTLGGAKISSIDSPTPSLTAERLTFTYLSMSRDHPGPVGFPDDKGAGRRWKVGIQKNTAGWPGSEVKSSSGDEAGVAGTACRRK